MKRWKARIDESNARYFYKPCKENLLADGLSRQQLNALEEQESGFCVAIIHIELSLTYTIKTTENRWIASTTTFDFFWEKKWHTINFPSREALLDNLSEVIVPKDVNALHCDLHTLAMI